ncbi:MAG: antibiotic biosynthesis monooxygenase [Coleofasciculus sp. S288]|nr:antibiotic biosynthesis monooxygenase [Coleofasciculus sp. S288]
MVKSQFPAFKSKQPCSWANSLTPLLQKPLPKRYRKHVFSVLLLFTVFSTGCTSSIASKPTQDISKQETQELAQATQVDVPVVLASRFKIKPEKRDLFIKLATATLEPTRAEDGVISYSFYEESTVPNSFIYFEEWKSREALAEHLKQPYTERLLEQFPDMLDGEPNIRVYDIKSLTYGLDEGM